MQLEDISLFVEKNLFRLRKVEAFVGYLVYNRKWSTTQNNNLFRGLKNPIVKTILVGDTEAIKKGIFASLYLLTNRASKNRLSKLYTEDPYSLSFMVTFEPRDLMRALLNFLPTLNKIVLTGRADISPEQINILHNMEQEWLQCVAASDSYLESGRKCLLLNAVAPNPDWDIGGALAILQECLKQWHLDDIVKYICTTPEMNLQFVLPINKQTGPVLIYDFDQRQREVFTLFKKYKIPLKAFTMEIDNTLVHVPGINPNVVNLTLNVPNMARLQNNDPYNSCPC